MPGQETDGSLRERRITARGAATRDRIVQSAADLMYVQGVNATTLDDVIAASGISKSQLYCRPREIALDHVRSYLIDAGSGA